MGNIFCKKLTMDKDIKFDEKKTVKVSGVSHFLRDQFTKQLQGENSTGHHDDVNQLYICPRGEDHILVEFANDIPKDKKVKDTLKIAGMKLSVERWTKTTQSSEDLGSQSVSKIWKTEGPPIFEEQFPMMNETLPSSTNCNDSSKNGKKVFGKEARQHQFADRRGLNLDQKTVQETAFSETKVKLNDDLVKTIKEEAEYKQILREGKVEIDNNGYLTGTWNAIFAAGQKIVSAFRGSNETENSYDPGNNPQSSSANATDQSDASLTPPDRSDPTSTATDQSPQSKNPDDLFNVHPLFLRHIMAHHYDVFQKLENVAKEISMEIKSKTETNLKIFARNEVDKPTFSKSMDEFIRFYQTQIQKMHQEVIPIPSESKKDVFLETCKKFSVTIDSTQEPGKMTIYGEKEDVENTKRFLKGKVGDRSPGNVPSKETTAEVDRTEKLSFDFSQNLKLVVYRGDLTKENVDAIVNPANDRLQHGGGAAGAIVRAGGKTIQDDSDKIMWSRGRKPLQAGEVTITDAGRLPCKFVVHAVGPVWSQHPPNTAKQILYNAVNNSLYIARRYNATSISIPAIGSGLYQVPVNICAEVLFEAVETFASNAEKTSPLREIRFVNIDKPTNRVFVQEMEKRFQGFVTREKVQASLPNNTRKEERHTQITPRPQSDHDQTIHVTNKGSSHKLKSDDNKNADKTPTLASYAAAAGKPSSIDIVPTSGSYGKKSKDDECSICLSEFTKKKTLDKCGHSFCTKCIDRAFKTKKQCPLCFAVYGPLKGNQPKGYMFDSFQSTYLPGFSSYGTIVLSYRFPNGIQGPDHPNPGKPYTGTSRTAYLPDNEQGRKVRKLLKKAFEQKLTFTIGRSVTTGEDNCVIWNDIHHKTSVKGGPTHYGYPDADYLKRVTDELAAKGITE